MTVAAIIPAYNEENTVAGVLEAVAGSGRIDQVICVSDGSEDRTVEEASRFDNVIVIDLLTNRGKGGAVKAGLDRCDADIILVLDADLIGLTESHINDLLDPVLKGAVLMTVGVFEKGRMATDFAQKMAPFLSGQRAMHRSLLENISDLDLSRYGLEVALHSHVGENDIPTETIQLPDLSHVMKEEKLGLWKGISARSKMYWEILRYLAGVPDRGK